MSAAEPQDVDTMSIKALKTLITAAVRDRPPVAPVACLCRRRPCALVLRLPPDTFSTRNPPRGATQGLSTAGCFEKSELRVRAREAQERLSAKAPAATGAAAAEEPAAGGAGAAAAAGGGGAPTYTSSNVTMAGYDCVVKKPDGDAPVDLVVSGAASRGAPPPAAAAPSSTQQHPAAPSSTQQHRQHRQHLQQQRRE